MSNVDSNIQFLLRFYEENHFRELDEKDKINSSVSIHLALITLMFGGLLFIIKELHLVDTQLICIIYTLIISSAILLFIDVIKIFEILTGHDYDLLPNPALMEKYRRELKASNRDVAETEFEYEFMEELLTYYVDCSSKNRTINKNKIEARRNAFQWLRVTWIIYFILIFIFLLTSIS